MEKSASGFLNSDKCIIKIIFLIMLSIVLKTLLLVLGFLLYFGNVLYLLCIICIVYYMYYILAWSGKYLTIILLNDRLEVQSASDIDGFSSQRNIFAKI